MPSQSYIEAHELYQAFRALCRDEGGLGDIKTLYDWDIDPLDEQAETLVTEAIIDQAEGFRADDARRAA